MNRMGGSRQLAIDVYGRGQRSWTARLGLWLLLALTAVAGAGFGRLSVVAPAPPQVPSRSVAAGVPGVGASAVAHGIPVGYQHSALGAAQAAGNYLASLGGQLDPARARAALDQVAEPTSRQRLEKGLDASLQVEEQLWAVQAATRQGQRVVLTQTPIAYRTDTYTADEATVRVWLVTIVGVADRQRLAAFYGISGATLTWLDGDWRLRSIDGGSQAGDVVPAGLQTPTPTGGVPATLDGFVPYGS
jgi:hypothetical protein